MSDEKGVSALISAIGTLRDRLRRDIDGLRQIHNRWRDGNASAMNLIAQLTALKSNLGNTQDWLNCAVQDLHPQLLSDLDLLTHSCEVLVRHADCLNERLRYPDHGAVDCAAKMKYKLASRTMDRLQTVAQRQSDAVTLLLAACNCTAQAQRKILLHKSRQIRKEDAANLRTLSQSSRWNGSCITGLTQLSRFIQWLRIILHMKPSRSDLEGAISPSDEEYEQYAAADRSEAIDRALQRAADSLQHETKLVLLGGVNSGKDLIMHQLKVLYAEGYYSAEERMKYRCQVYQVVYALIHSITTLLKDTGVILPAELNPDFAILLNELDAGTENLTPEVVKAITRIWSCSEFARIYVKNFEIEFPQYAPYFAQEIPRIAEEDYIPIEADIIRLNQSMRGIKELRFNWDELDVHLFNIKGYVPQHFRERWFHQLEGATSLIYAVDMSLYDKPNSQRAGESLLLNELAAFESWVNEPVFAESSIILILNNFNRFMGKMPYSPLEKVFPDYVSNESDPEGSARQYILRRFKNMNHQGLPIYSFWVDLDSGDNKQLYEALKVTIAQIQQRKEITGRSRADTTATESSVPSNKSLPNILRPSRSRSLSKLKLQNNRPRVFDSMPGESSKGSSPR